MQQNSWYPLLQKTIRAPLLRQKADDVRVVDEGKTLRYYLISERLRDTFPMFYVLQHDDFPYLSNSQKVHGRFFFRFDDYKGLLTFYETAISNKIRLNFYEEFHGHRPLKFYMDLDFKIKKDEFINYMMIVLPFYPTLEEGEKLDIFYDYVDTLMHDLLITIRERWVELLSRPFDPDHDVIIYHSPANGIRSYHLIFPTLIVSDSRFCRAIFNYFTRGMITNFFLDGSVYKDKYQAFRLVYSSKRDDNDRTKKPMYEWSFGTTLGEGISGRYNPWENIPIIPDVHIDREKLKLRRELLDSFISVFDNSGVSLTKLDRSLLDIQPVTTRVARQPSSKNNLIPEPPEDIIPEGFELGDRNGDNSYMLLRTEPSYCILCKDPKFPKEAKWHDNQNALLIYQPGTGSWYYDCFRNLINKEYGGNKRIKVFKGNRKQQVIPDEDVLEHIESH